MPPADAVESALKQRLGRLASATRREVRALAPLVEGEEIQAVVFALWNKQGWIVAATDGGLRLARRPRLGRARDVKAAWSDLTDVRAGSQRVDLGFGRLEVRLSFVQPHDEFVHLVEAARRRVPGGAGDVTVAELRELARRKLGRMLAFAHESAIEALPDRLEPDERVERLATATVGFKGLLAVTNRRVLLFEPGFRAAGERLWTAERREITGAEPAGDGLRLELSSGTVVLEDVLPLERRDELLAVLG